jgi:hypothetical protein
MFYGGHITTKTLYREVDKWIGLLAGSVSSFVVIPRVIRCIVVDETLKSNVLHRICDVVTNSSNCRLLFKEAVAMIVATSSPQDQLLLMKRNLYLKPHLLLFFLSNS